MLICEFTLQNRDSEIEKLKQELETVKNRLHCEECDFSSATEIELKCHMGDQHEHHCPYCDCKFVGEKKLEKHLCRVYVTNPCSEQFGFFTKDWFEREKCIRIFDNASKEEVIVLHSENCVEQKVCLELPLNFKKEKYFKDTHGMIHLIASDYMESNNMKWMTLFGMRLLVKQL